MVTNTSSFSCPKKNLCPRASFFLAPIQTLAITETIQLRARIELQYIDLKSNINIHSTHYQKHHQVVSDTTSAQKHAPDKPISEKASDVLQKEQFLAHSVVFLSQKKRKSCQQTMCHPKERNQPHCSLNSCLEGTQPQSHGATM